MARYTLQGLAVLMGVVALSYGWPSGAPNTACHNMFPSGHGGFQAQTEPGPFEVVVSRNPHSSSVEVVIRSKDQNRFFRGFMISAINPAGAKTGKFVDLVDAQGVNCDGSPDLNAATHVSKHDKDQIKLNWIPTEAGEVMFTATIVETYTNFYTNVRSKPISN